MTTDVSTEKDVDVDDFPLAGKWTCVSKVSHACVGGYGDQENNYVD